MSLVVPNQDLKDFDDYRHWLCKSGVKYYEQVWSFRNKEMILQEYIAVCYALKIQPKFNKEDALTIQRLTKKN